MSRQIKWQQDRINKGLCPVCGKKALSGHRYCIKHGVLNNEAQRKRNGSKKRNKSVYHRALEQLIIEKRRKEKNNDQG